MVLTDELTVGGETMTDFLDCTTREELLIMAAADGCRIDADERITNPGRFELERVEILYWDAASLNGDGELYSFDEDSGAVWFELNAQDLDVCGWPQVPGNSLIGGTIDATHARLEWTSQGFLLLSYWGDDASADPARVQIDLDARNEYFWATSEFNNG